ncbi:MAG: hypothetical protein QOJ63_1991 [Solirubrobacteraceae bacterium]|nr:hypothetical protein [Solirubrobacteraceae bacterium]
MRAKQPPLTHTELYESEAWRDKAPDETWVPYPSGAGEYYVDLMVTDPHDTHHRQFVARNNTHTFRVSGS